MSWYPEWPVDRHRPNLQAYCSSSAASPSIILRGILLVQFLRFLNDFLLIFHITLGRRIFLSFITKVRRRDLHLLPIT